MKSCLECPNRKLHCHANCADFIIRTAEHNEINQKRKAEHETIDYYVHCLDKIRK